MRSRRTAQYLKGGQDNPSDPGGRRSAPGKAVREGVGREREGRE
jgi:hypothetical protein